ncbi:MAG: hypothetical protein Q7K03_12370 [Dehalococcoidia bacterium]|nr:hypothetical protein [Dehalococcoidia bacterium]
MNTRRDIHALRRLFHMAAASLFPILALFLEKRTFLLLLLVVTALFVLADVARLRLVRLNLWWGKLFGPLLRQGEERRVTGASYILLGTLGAFVLFSRDAAVLAVLFTALGDPVAAMVGIRLPGRRLFGKSLWGTAAMIAVGLGVAGAMQVAGVIDFRWAIAVGALVAGIAELLPLPLDDNLRVPLLAGAAMALLGT